MMYSKKQPMDTQFKEYSLMLQEPFRKKLRTIYKYTDTAEMPKV